MRRWSIVASVVGVVVAAAAGALAVQRARRPTPDAPEPGTGAPTAGRP